MLRSGLLAVLIASIDGEAACWELPGEVSSARHADEIAVRDREVARCALELAVTEGWINLRRRTSWVGGTETQVDEEASLVAIETGAVWVSPSHDGAEWLAELTDLGGAVLTAVQRIYSSESFGGSDE